MSSSKKINTSSVPVLTETVDADMPGIPTLTEIHIETPAFLSDAQCQQLAKQIAPQLETLLRAKLLQEIQANLPELIRSAMNKPSSK